MRQTQTMVMPVEPKGIPHYPCPMCGTPVYSSAFQCPSCGTDLTRAGVVLSSSSGGSSAAPARQRRRSGFWVVFVLVMALAVAAGTVGRPWMEQFAAPGMAVVRVAAQQTLQSVQQSVSQLPAKIRQATTGRRGTKVQTPAKASPKTAAATPARPVATSTKPATTVAPFAVTPAAVTAPTAILTISSTPRGARVQVDGVARGLTPVTVKELRAGSHNVRVSQQGYRPVIRTVTLQPGKTVSLGVRLPSQTPPKVATSAPKPAPARVQTAALLEVGRVAPQFVAKDRVGLLYRTGDYRGRKLLLVFVQNLDGNAQRIIRELNTIREGGARGAAVVVVLRPDRASIRQFTQAERIQIPVLFGTQAVARAYGVGSQPVVLYLVSEEGRVVLRQVGRVNPGAVLN